MKNFQTYSTGHTKDCRALQRIATDKINVDTILWRRALANGFNPKKFNAKQKSTLKFVKLAPQLPEGRLNERSTLKDLLTRFIKPLLLRWTSSKCVGWFYVDHEEYGFFLQASSYNGMKQLNEQYVLKDVKQCLNNIVGWESDSIFTYAHMFLKLNQAMPGKKARYQTPWFNNYNAILKKHKALHYLADGTTTNSETGWFALKDFNNEAPWYGILTIDSVSKDNSRSIALRNDLVSHFEDFQRAMTQELIEVYISVYQGCKVQCTRGQLSRVLKTWLAKHGINYDSDLRDVNGRTIFGFECWHTTPNGEAMVPLICFKNPEHRHQLLTFCRDPQNRQDLPLIRSSQTGLRHRMYFNDPTYKATYAPTSASDSRSISGISLSSQYPATPTTPIMDKFTVPNSGKTKLPPSLNLKVGNHVTVLQGSNVRRGQIVDIHFFDPCGEARVKLQSGEIINTTKDKLRPCVWGAPKQAQPAAQPWPAAAMPALAPQAPQRPRTWAGMAAPKPKGGPRIPPPPSRPPPRPVQHPWRHADTDAKDNTYNQPLRAAHPVQMPMATTLTAAEQRDINEAVEFWGDDEQQPKRQKLRDADGPRTPATSDSEASRQLGEADHPDDLAMTEVDAQVPTGCDEKQQEPQPGAAGAEPVSLWGEEMDEEEENTSGTTASILTVLRRTLQDKHTAHAYKCCSELHDRIQTIENASQPSDYNPDAITPSVIRVICKILADAYAVHSEGSSSSDMTDQQQMIIYYLKKLARPKSKLLHRCLGLKACTKKNAREKVASVHAHIGASVEEISAFCLAELRRLNVLKQSDGLLQAIVITAKDHLKRL